MQFVTSCYGENYAPFLAVCLRSLRLSNPDCRVLVTHDDISAIVIEALSAQNPNARFIALANAPRESDMGMRIGAKLDFWRAALEEAEDDIVTFIDTDMIVRSAILGALPDGADVLITLKDEQIPINTGTIIFRRGPATSIFMQEWQRMTAKVCENKELVRAAAAKSGGPTQHALLLMMATDRPGMGITTIEIDGNSVNIYGAPCSILNETNSVPLTSPAKILHYKGAWHRILLKGKGYNSRRTKQASKDMLQLWRNMLRDEECEIGMKLMPMKSRARIATRALFDRVWSGSPD